MCVGLYIYNILLLLIKNNSRNSQVCQTSLWMTFANANSHAQAQAAASAHQQ